MATQNRPLSPHLQIYRLPLVALLSISHRATGVALAAGSIVLVWWLASAASGPQAFETAQSVIGSWIGRLFLFGWTVAFFFHMANGVRHLAWDLGYGFAIPDATRSGQAALAFAGGASLLAWIFAYAFM